MVWCGEVKSDARLQHACQRVSVLPTVVLTTCVMLEITSFERKTSAALDPDKPHIYT